MGSEQYRIHVFQKGAPVTLILIILNSLIYFIGLTLPPNEKIMLMNLFALSAKGFAGGAYWQILTYEFLHGGLLHLVINMVGLWFVGREMELVLGTVKYLFLYFAGGIVGGLFQICFSGMNSELIGASAAVFAVMIAFTTIYPNVRIVALIFFVIPLRMKAWVLGCAVVIVSILFWVSGFEKDVGHLAHLGGCLVGFILGIVWKRGLGPLPLEPGNPPVNPSFSQVKRQEPATEVEQVLEKIVQEGFDSLNAEERLLLEQWRTKLSRRPDFSQE